MKPGSYRYSLRVNRIGMLSGDVGWKYGRPVGYFESLVFRSGELIYTELPYKSKTAALANGMYNLYDLRKERFSTIDNEVHIGRECINIDEAKKKALRFFKKEGQISFNGMVKLLRGAS